MGPVADAPAPDFLPAVSDSAALTPTELGVPSTPTDLTAVDDTGDSAGVDVQPVTLTGTVTAIVDGDTVCVRFTDGRDATVDLAGVDAPELYSATDPTLFETVPDTEGGVTYLHVRGWTADRAVAREILGERVEVQVLDSHTTISSLAEPYLVYDAVDTVYVAYVTREGSSVAVNLALVQSGLARATGDDHAERDVYVAAEVTARSGKLGLWHVDDPLSVP